MLLTAPSDQRIQLDDLFEQLGQTLDLPPAMREKAVSLYEAVGAHLGRSASRLLGYDPQVYPQGSFALGTMILPINPACGYDVDLVCLLSILKEATTQAYLKAIVGDELRLGYGPILESGRRCWTLQFDKLFHMDVLPSIPDVERGGTAILLTDTELVRWQYSDPKAYVQWFVGRMATVLNLMKQELALSLRASVDDIPDWQIRTPLQRAIQLLKRHRDLFFREHPDRRPASIIITSLVARAYLGERSIFEAFENGAKSMQVGLIQKDGRYNIPNPVNPKENFADRWNEFPERATYFRTWASALAVDLATWKHSAPGVHHLSDAMSPAFGQDVVRKAVEHYGESLATRKTSGALRMATGSGLIVGPSFAAAAVPVRRHTFFGD